MVYIVCVLIPVLSFYLTAEYAIKNVPVTHYIVKYIAAFFGGFCFTYLVSMAAKDLNIIKIYTENEQIWKNHNLGLLNY